MKTSNLRQAVRSLAGRSAPVCSKRPLHGSSCLQKSSSSDNPSKPPSVVLRRPFPPTQLLSSRHAAVTMNAKLWASLQPPPESALSALAARLRIPVASDSNSEHAITLPLLAQAVTHPSFVSLHQQHYPHELPPAHNGLLAALGNHLMGLFATEWITATYPHLPTNVVKAAISAYVGPTTASALAREWGAVPLVRWSRSSETLTKPAVYHDEAMASVARAIVGLLYHAGGSTLDEPRKFVHAHFLSREFDPRPLLKFADPKLALIHTTRKYEREAPVSRLLQESGRHTNSPTFVVGVFSGSDKLGEGFGSSLQMAEYRAAEDAMHRLYLTRQPVTDSMLPTTAFPTSSSLTPEESSTEQKNSKPSFGLLELSALPPRADANETQYTPGILGESEALYGSAGRTGLRVGRGATPVRS